MSGIILEGHKINLTPQGKKDFRASTFICSIHIADHTDENSDSESGCDMFIRHGLAAGLLLLKKILIILWPKSGV